jgi:mannose-6-phosphate isomerase-like protein (cupin superfamily)
MTGTRLVHQDLFGGRGKVTVELVLERQPPGFECALRCTLAPGGSVGAHLQEECDEVVVVLSGRGRATVDGTRHKLEPGSIVPLQLGQELALFNTSKTAPLRYLIIKARPPPQR